MTHNIDNPQKNGVKDFAQFFEIREALHSKGYFIHPIKQGEKRPLTSSWQTTQCKSDLLKRPIMVGLGMGHKNLWALDVDSKNWPNGTEDLNRQVLEFVKSTFTLNHFVYQYSQSGGLHIIFKIEDAPWDKLGNAKYAKTAKGDDLLESRGKGGQIVIYDESGIWSQLDRLKPIGMADLSQLIEFAKTFDFQHKEVTQWTPDHGRWIDKGNNRWIALEYLKSFGWEIVKEESDKYLVKRPNSANPHSGTCWKETGSIWLWSSGNTGLEEERTYSPWDIYQMNKTIEVETETKKSKKQAYRIMNMNEYMRSTLTFPRLTYMMDGYICLGQLTFLFGPEKVGKSPVAMEIALNIAEGKNHFGKFRNDAGPVPVAYLDNELKERNVRKRFSSDEQQMILHEFPSNFVRIDPYPEVTHEMTDKEIMDATLDCIELAREREGIQFVVIDNMAPLLSDEEKATTAKKFISRLIQYADKTNMGMLVIQHVTKQYENSVLRTSAMRGSGRLKDMAAGLIGMNMNGKTGQKYLKFFPSRNVDIPEEGVMRFEFSKPEARIIVEPQEWGDEVQLLNEGDDSFIDEILNMEHVEIGSAFIRMQREGKKADTIAKELGCSRQHLYDCKKVFEKWEKQNIDNKALRDKALELSPIPGDSVL